MCCVILRGQQVYTNIQAVHSLLYIVAKCHLFSVVIWKVIIKYLQKCEGCTHFCEILYICIYTAGKISIEHVTIVPDKYVSKGAVDMKLAPDVDDNPSNPCIKK